MGSVRRHLLEGCSQKELDLDWFMIFSVILLALHLASCLIVAFRQRSGFLPLTGTPPRVTILRPVCGRDAHDRETLESSFTINYPSYSVLFCVVDHADPVVPLIEGLIASYPQVDAQLLIGDDCLTANPKLNNLSKGWAKANGAFVVMADSNLLLPVDYIWRLLEAQASDVGLVSCPPIGCRPDGLWARLECAFLNGNQARLQLAADSLGFGFAQGKTMMWDPNFLNRNGGLAALGKNLAEDVAATHLVRKAGQRVALPHTLFTQPIGRRSLRQVWNRQVRWSKVRRDGFPALFLFEPVNGALLAIVMAGLGGGVGFAALIATLWYGAETLLCLREKWMACWTDILLFPLRDALIPMIWMSTLRNRTFEWRGNAMSPGSLQRLAG